VVWSSTISDGVVVCVWCGDDDERGEDSKLTGVVVVSVFVDWENFAREEG